MCMCMDRQGWQFQVHIHKKEMFVTNRVDNTKKYIARHVTRETSHNNFQEMFLVNSFKECLFLEKYVPK